MIVIEGIEGDAQGVTPVDLDHALGGQGDLGPSVSEDIPIETRETLIETQEEGGHDLVRTVPEDIDLRLGGGLLIVCGTDLPLAAVTDLLHVVGTDLLVRKAKDILVIKPVCVVL